MKKLNLDELSLELEVINSDQLYYIKGGYGSDTNYGGYGDSSLWYQYADGGGGYSDSGGGGGSSDSGSGGGSSDSSWSSVVAAAENGSLPAGTYTNTGDGYTYTPPPATDPSENDPSGSVSVIGGGTGNGNDCVFQCMAYANNKLGGTWNINTYEGEYTAEYGGDSEDGVAADDIQMFANATNLTTFNVNLSAINGFVPSNEVIMTDINAGPGNDHEEIITYVDQAHGTVLLLDPQNNNAVSVANINDIGCTNLIGFNGAH